MALVLLGLPGLAFAELASDISQLLIDPAGFACIQATLSTNQISPLDLEILSVEKSADGLHFLIHANQDGGRPLTIRIDRQAGEIVGTKFHPDFACSISRP